MLAGILVGDRRRGYGARNIVDEHGARLGDGLQARGGVDRVADDQALGDGVELDRRPSGEHPGAEPQLESEPVAERRHRGHQVERRPHRPLGVVLLGHWGTPQGHHGIADELLDPPAVGGDDPARGLEVLRKHLPHILGVACLAEPGEPGEVGEQHRHLPALDRGGGHDCGQSGSGPRRRGAAAVGRAPGPGACRTRGRTFAGLGGRVPHRPQRGSSGAPHSPQNFAPSGRCWRRSGKPRSRRSRIALRCLELAWQRGPRHGGRGGVGPSAATVGQPPP